jgi:hypothetical protein
VYSAELNVVLFRKLWPRGMVQPPLTEADRRSMAAQAEQNQRRPEQRVHVSFEGEAQTERERREQRRDQERAQTVGTASPGPAGPTGPTGPVGAAGPAEAEAAKA